jgi:hypothetical protein
MFSTSSPVLLFALYYINLSDAASLARHIRPHFLSAHPTLCPRPLATKCPSVSVSFHLRVSSGDTETAAIPSKGGKLVVGKWLGVYRLCGTEIGYSVMLNLEFRSANGTVRFFVGSLHLLRPPVYEGLGFRVSCFGFRFTVWGLGFRFTVWGLAQDAQEYSKLN